MFWLEFEVRSMERAFRHRSPKTSDRPVVFYGSSSIRLWTSLADDLGEADVVNLGFGGSTMADCDHYFERLVLPRRPRSLVLYVGDNDLGTGRSVDDILDSFRSLLARFDAQLGPIPFHFLSIKPSPALWPRFAEIVRANTLIRDELASRPRSGFIDIVEPMFGPRGEPRAELFLDDGLHLSRAGYLVWLKRIQEHRQAIFHPLDISDGSGPHQ
jgi:lysophospholipase L1-like esterase